MDGPARAAVLQRGALAALLAAVLARRATSRMVALPKPSSAKAARAASTVAALFWCPPTFHGRRGARIDRCGARCTELYADLAALITHLRLQRPTVVGFASAGHVAPRFAAEHPDLLGKLAVLNASPRFRRGEHWPHGFDEAGIARFTHAARDRGIEGITDAVLDPDLVFADVDDARAAEIGAAFRDELGPEAVGQRLEQDQALIECRHPGVFTV